jgi:mono/diheme cytochrome c family protein
LRSFTVVVTALAGGLAEAQDLDQGKSGTQLFATNCMNCHHSPNGLAHDRLSWTLLSFLQEHYTTSPASAQALTVYLESIDARRSNPQPAVHNRRAAENSASASASPPSPSAPHAPQTAARNLRTPKNGASVSPLRPPEPVPAH